jgi:hypothetical protein
LIKVFFINLIVFLAILIPIDFGLGYFYNDSVSYMCRDKHLHHRYCPSSVRTYKMADVDGGMVHESYWDKTSVRVKTAGKKRGSTDFKKFKNVIIGDSFVAQRQVSFESRVSSLVNKSLGEQSFVQFGTGSWNFVTYLQALKQIEPVENQTIHFFLMANDFYSYYGLSNLSYYESSVSRVVSDLSWRSEETLKSMFLRFLSNRSFIFQSLKFKLAKTNPSGSKKNGGRVLVKLPHVSSKCDLLKSFFEKLGETRTYSLVEHSFEEACFSSNLKRNIEIATMIHEYIQKLATQKKFILKYYFVPNGTIFQDEVEEFKIVYGLDPSSILTSEGLRMSLQKRMGVPIFSFEKHFKESYKIGDDLYYRYDGHWNSLGSASVAKALLGNMMKSGN